MIVKFLLWFNADKEIKDNYGLKAVDYAKRHQKYNIENLLN